MSVNYRHFFAYQDIANQRTWNVKTRKHALVIERYHRQIINFKTVCHVTNAFSVFIKMSDYNYFVSELEQALRQLKYMRLYAAHVRIEKIRDHTLEKNLVKEKAKIFKCID